MSSCPLRSPGPEERFSSSRTASRTSFPFEEARQRGPLGAIFHLAAQRATFPGTDPGSSRACCKAPRSPARNSNLALRLTAEQQYLVRPPGHTPEIGRYLTRCSVRERERVPSGTTRVPRAKSTIVGAADESICLILEALRRTHPVTRRKEVLALSETPDRGSQIERAHLSRDAPLPPIQLVARPSVGERERAGRARVGARGLLGCNQPGRSPRRVGLRGIPGSLRVMNLCVVTSGSMKVRFAKHSAILYWRTSLLSASPASSTLSMFSKPIAVLT